MFIKKTQHTVGDSIKTQIRLVESYRPEKGANSKQRVIEDFGWLEDKKDPDAFLKELEIRCQEAKANKIKLDIRIDPNKAIHDNISAVMCYGPFILKNIYTLLDLPGFFRDHRVSKAQYDLDRIFMYLVTMRCVLPDSKRATFSYIRNTYNMSQCFELEDIYHALDEIAALRFELQKWINKKLNEIFDIDAGYTYFDITNFYFEKDYALPGTLPQTGVSKEHRTTPIVQSALMLNSSGHPVFTEAFPGNTSEKLMLQPMVEKAVEMGIVRDRTVIVADKGINSGPNIDYLTSHGHGYLFSQTLKGKAGTRYRKGLFDPQGWVYREDGNYRYKLYEEEYTTKDIDGHKVKRKRLVLIYWSRSRAERDRNRRENKVSRAQKKLDNNVYKATHSTDAYLKNDICDNETGEIRNADVVTSLNTDKIQEEEKLDGYQCIITSETEYTEREIRICYHKLWMIEQSYRIEKSDLETRPIYVRLDDRIRGHLTMCHVGLLFMRLIQLSMGKDEISAERIRRVLNQCLLITPQQGAVMLLDPSQKIQYQTYIGKNGQLEYTTATTSEDEVLLDFDKVMKGLGVPLTWNSKAVYRQEEFNRMISGSKINIGTGCFRGMQEDFTNEELDQEDDYDVEDIDEEE